MYRCERAYVFSSQCIDIMITFVPTHVFFYVFTNTYSPDFSKQYHIVSLRSVNKTLVCSNPKVIYSISLAMKKSKSSLTRAMIVVLPNLDVPKAP